MRSKTFPLVRSELLGLFANRFTADRMYSRHIWKKLHHQVQLLLSQKRKTFSSIFIAFLESTQNFAHFDQNDQLHSLNISEVIDPDKCGYFNIRNVLFNNTLCQYTCLRITNTSGTCTTTLLSHFSVNLGQSELEKISLSHITSLRTLSQQVHCRSLEFLS